MNRTKQRFWLCFNPVIQYQPLSLVTEFTSKFDLLFHIRNSCADKELSVIGIELEGRSNAIGDAVEWLESIGVNVEPVELSIIQ